MVLSQSLAKLSGGRPRAEIVLFGVAMFYAAMVGSHLLRAVMYPWVERWGGVRLALTLFGLVLVLATGLGMAAYGVVSWGWDAFALPPLPWIIMQFGYFLGLWTAVYVSVQFFRRDREAREMRLRLETARREAELRALRARINPHFLFNSLNTLRALIPRELDRPRTAVTLLADLLRASLRMDDQDLVTLAEEMENVGNYLALEQLRLGERLRVVRDIDTAEAGWRLPPFLLQGLVENAVRHGVARRESGGTVTIRGVVEDGMLRVRVSNPGNLTPGEVEAGRSLAEARCRLALLLGPAARLDLRAGVAGCEEVEAELVLPRPGREGMSG